MSAVSLDISAKEKFCIDLNKAFGSNPKAKDYERFTASTGVKRRTARYYLTGNSFPKNSQLLTLIYKEFIYEDPNALFSELPAVIQHYILNKRQPLINKGKKVCAKVTEVFNKSDLHRKIYLSTASSQFEPLSTFVVRRKYGEYGIQIAEELIEVGAITIVDGYLLRSVREVDFSDAKAKSYALQDLTQKYIENHGDSRSTTGARMLKSVLGFKTFYLSQEKIELVNQAMFEAYDKIEEIAQSEKGFGKELFGIGLVTGSINDF